MSAIAPAPLPAISLLARHRGPECYRDAFCAHVPRAVSLSEFIAAFYSSPAFTPERMLLHLIGKGAKAMTKLETDKPELWAEVNQAYAARRAQIEGEGKPTEDTGEGFTEEPNWSE